MKFEFFQKSLYEFESHDCLDMMCMREHIDRSDIGDAVSREGESLLIASLSDKDLEVTSESRRVTGDIDDLTSSESEDMWECARMHAITRGIEDDGEFSLIDSVFRAYFSDKIFHLCIHKTDICDTIFGGISLTVSTRTLDELDRVDLTKMLCQEDTDSPCTSVEIEESTSLVLDHIDRSGVEFLSTESVDLEETLGCDLKSLSEKLLFNRRLSCQKDLISRDDICFSSILEEVYRVERCIFFGQLSNHICEKIFHTSLYTPPGIIPRSIHREYEHRLSRLLGRAHDQVSPKSHLRLRIICRKA